jgi:hypothetical protein
MSAEELERAMCQDVPDDVICIAFVDRDWLAFRMAVCEVGVLLNPLLGVSKTFRDFGVVSRSSADEGLALRCLN